MSIESWTDLDYAQAAIDMLPGTVEEITVHMKAHKIKGTIRSSRVTDCPIAQWAGRWTDGMVLVNHTEVHNSGWVAWSVRFPIPVQDFILAFDRGDIRL